MRTVDPQVGDQLFRVEVGRSPLVPDGRDPPSLDEAPRAVVRGVRIVDLLSDSWGIVPTEDGKAVWSRLSPS